MSKNVVLVTGAHGFIGRYIAKVYAQNGWYVIGVGHGEWNDVEQLAWGVAKWHHLDVTKQNLIDLNINPNVIIHAAGGSSVPLSIQNPELDFEKTVTSTAEVLKYLREKNTEIKFVYLSTAGVYGAAESLPISESAKLNPLSPYGKHKLLAENLCIEYSNKYNLSTAVIRLFSVYGAGLQKQLLWDALNKVQDNQSNFFGTGEEVRDWLHVRDAASLIYKFAPLANKNCLIVNGGSGVGITVRELLMQLFLLCDFNQVAHFSGIAREGDPIGYIADISVAKAIGWEPEVSLNKGLQEYIGWFKGMRND